MIDKERQELPSGGLAEAARMVGAEVKVVNFPCEEPSTEIPEDNARPN